MDRSNDHSKYSKSLGLIDITSSVGYLVYVMYQAETAPIYNTICKCLCSKVTGSQLSLLHEIETEN